MTNNSLRGVAAKELVPGEKFANALAKRDDYVQHRVQHHLTHWWEEFQIVQLLKLLYTTAEVITEGLVAGLRRIAIDPKILGGKPVIKGTRIPVYLIVELLASGMTEKEVLKEYPGLHRDDVRAALQYASRVLRQEEVIPIEA